MNTIELASPGPVIASILILSWIWIGEPEHSSYSPHNAPTEQHAVHSTIYSDLAISSQ